MLSRYLQFKDSIWPTKVKFAGNMRRKDLDAVVVSNNNNYISEKLGAHYNSTKMIKRDDFSNYRPFHFDREGEGYRHLAPMILSVFDEFVKNW